MAWFDPLLRWLGLSEKRSDVGFETWEMGGASAGSSANPTGLVPFFASVRHIVDFMSTLPVDAYRVNGDNRVSDVLPSLIRRLNEPGGIGVETWIGQWAYGLAVNGNAVGWVTAVDSFALPIGIRWLSAADWDYDEYARQWYVFGTPVPAERIVHCPWIVPPGKTLGLSPMDHFAAFWRAGKAAQEYADVSRGGGVPTATLQNTEQVLQPETATTIQTQLVRSFESGKPFVSGKDWKLEIKDIPPNQMKFLETLQLTANQTAAIFGIDPREIGGTGASGSITYVNDESKSLDRANNMRPYLVRFEAMVARILPERQYIRLNVDATIRTDIKTRTEIIGAQLADGRLSLDEARALEDRPPLPNGQGQYFNVPRPAAEPPATRATPAPLELLQLREDTDMTAKPAALTEGIGDTP